MIDKLIIIGNGFDIWQGLDTSYKSFHNYYKQHLNDILRKLHLKKHEYIDENGKSYFLSDVELVYGDPFSPEELDDAFWNTFELSLDKVDSERLNLFFGKTEEELYELQEAVENAQNILREAFSAWIQSIPVASCDSGYTFGEDCYCINFNYTNTVESRFGCPKEYHIHGEKEDGIDIVFGHASHPQRPIQELAEFGGRFMGLYQIDNLLYETDKDTFSNIQFLRIDLASKGVKLDEIRDIYVLGQSFSDVDFDYFKYIHQETSVSVTHRIISEKRDLEKWYRELNTLDELHLRIQYVIHRYGENSPVSAEETEAVSRMLEFEHAFDEEDILRDFYPHLPELKRKGNCREDAKWHISYFNDEDKQRIENLMSRIGCANYELHSSIDECIKEFRTT